MKKEQNKIKKQTVAEIDQNAWHKCLAFGGSTAIVKVAPIDSDKNTSVFYVMP